MRNCSMSSLICASFIHSLKPTIVMVGTVVLEEVLEVGECFVLLMEDENPLVLVNLDLLLGSHLLLQWLLLPLLTLLMIQLGLLRAHQTLIQQILILQLVDILIPKPLLALNMVLHHPIITHRSQWSQPIHLSSSSFSQLLE